MYLTLQNVWKFQLTFLPKYFQSHNAKDTYINS